MYVWLPGRIQFLKLHCVQEGLLPIDKPVRRNENGCTAWHVPLSDMRCELADFSGVHRYIVCVLNVSPAEQVQIPG